MDKIIFLKKNSFEQASSDIPIECFDIKNKLFKCNKCGYFRWFGKDMTSYKIFVKHYMNCGGTPFNKEFLEYINPKYFNLGCENNL